MIENNSIENNSSDSLKIPIAIVELRYRLEDKPALLPGLLFGLQHVFVMFTAMMIAPLAISQILNLSTEAKATMISGVMLGCGIGTLISSVGVGFIGARLPIVLGSYAVFIAPIVAIAKTSGLAAATTATFIGGGALLCISPVIGKMRPLFPPIVVGSVLVSTGITLIRLAVHVASGANTKYAGSVNVIIFALGSIGLILAINRLSRGLLQALSVFVALVAVYIVSILLGFSDTSSIANASWFALPRLAPYGWFAMPTTSALLLMFAYYLVAAVYTMSITLALCSMLDIDGTEWRVRGAVAADGFGSMVGALFGGVPLISYDQNVGAISLTGVGSRFVVAIAGAILIAMALVPKIAAMIAIAPPFILGGTLIFMFAMIIAVGVGILADSAKSQRDLLLLAMSVGLAVAVDFAPTDVFEVISPSLRILVSDGILVGTVTAVLLNILLPAQVAPVSSPPCGKASARGRALRSG
jgi:uracil-xanthine permease